MSKTEPQTIKIARMRPVTWRISVQGRDEADHVRRVLHDTRIQTTQPDQEPGLTEPPVWAFDATIAADAPFTAEELIAILKQDPRIELDFEAQ